MHLCRQASTRPALRSRRATHLGRLAKKRQGRNHVQHLSARSQWRIRLPRHRQRRLPAVRQRRRVKCEPMAQQWRKDRPMQENPARRARGQSSFSLRCRRPQRKTRRVAICERPLHKGPATELRQTSQMPYRAHHRRNRQSAKAHPLARCRLCAQSSMRPRGQVRQPLLSQCLSCVNGYYIKKASANTRRPNPRTNHA